MRASDDLLGGSVGYLCTMNRVTYTVIGYILFATGVISLILGSIGLSLFPLSYIDRNTSPLTAMIIKFIILIVGIVMFYMSRVNPEE